MADRFDVEVWDCDAEPIGRVLVLPGGMYTVDGPILYWACRVAAGAGWQVTTMRWQLDDAAWRHPVDFVEEAADRIDSIAPAAPVTVMIAKSFGTRAAAWAHAHRYAGVWLTPLLTESGVRTSLAAPGPPALTIGGNRDPVWDPDVAGQVRGTVITIDGADHSLHVGTDWRASLAALEQTAEAIESFLRDQVSAVSR